MFEGCSGCCLGLILIPLLCCVMLACGVIYVYTNGPEPPLSNHFKPQQADAQSFQNVIDGAANQAASQGWFVIQFNEREMSSWLALKGKDFASTHDQRFPFQNVQVKLDNSKMIFYGELARGRFKLPLRATIKPQVDSKGQLDLKIESVDFGGLSVPGILLKSVKSTLQDALMQPLKDTGRGYFLYQQSLKVDNSTFAVQGQVK